MILIGFSEGLSMDEGRKFGMEDGVQVYGLSIWMDIIVENY